ncbi:DUF4328 domain-containing protein [Yinghuangia soli]|uniref:DUF4328 domain-containing protein n=1 Tax=Yinghuangia soli TaxID=2908204 RepID=A0AA41U0G7_9ACTN|nr:DUF4328 domain-containing protein [Yinghuangia soli]MCF2528420.1 DUF4328 domain-containing protein [Yinghuangia soli]
MQITLAIAMVAYVLAAIAQLMRASLVGDIKAGNVNIDDLESADTFVVTTGWIVLLATLVAGIVFITWFHRSRTNIAYFGLHKPDLGPGWSVGCWFVPILNLLFPAMIASDIWRGSEARRVTDATEQEADASPGFGRKQWILCWWGLLVFAVLLSRAAAWVVDDSTLDGVRTVDRMSAVASIVFAVAGLFAMIVVGKISAFQGERIAELEAPREGRSSGV